MKARELIEKIQKIRCGLNLDVIIRGEITGDISNVDIDFDHSDDRPFIAIDVEEFQPVIEDGKDFSVTDDTAGRFTSPHRIETTGG